MDINRRAVLIGGAATLLAGASGVGVVGSASAATVVDMEALLLAAQWDPRKPDQGITTGAKASVLAVEGALADEGLLAASYVDGHFGTTTVTAYAAWQRQLGYSGLAANGLPGSASLTALGSGRFTVTRVVQPGARTTFHGVTANARTKAMLVEGQSHIAQNLVMEQGSYSTSDPSSAGTHAGGGAVDIHVDNLTSTQRVTAVRELRKVGFAAWLRSPSQGDWDWHIHAVATSDPDLSTEAQHQIGDYYLGLNGLANRQPDDGPQVTKTAWEAYKRAHGL
ncbi:MAG: peptidoglycan-binding protein [Pedococcus sp.]